MSLRLWSIVDGGQRLVAFGDSISSFLCFFPFSFPPSLRAPASSQTEVIVSISFTSRLVFSTRAQQSCPGGWTDPAHQDTVLLTLREPGGKSTTLSHSLIPY